MLNRAVMSCHQKGKKEEMNNNLLFPLLKLIEKHLSRFEKKNT